MNILLWVLQVAAALIYGASGTMKVFLFDKISKDVPSFGALPRRAWTVLGMVEIVCTLGLIVPSALRWHPELTGVAAVVLAAESLLFVWIHRQYGERTPIVMSAVLGLLMVFLAYGRLVVKPLTATLHPSPCSSAACAASPEMAAGSLRSTVFASSQSFPSSFRT